MTTIELEAQKAVLVRDILTQIDDMDMVKKLRRQLDKLVKSKEMESETISKEEILAGIDSGLKEVQQTMVGKLKRKTAREFADEL